MKKIIRTLLVFIIIIIIILLQIYKKEISELENINEPCLGKNIEIKIIDRYNNMSKIHADPETEEYVTVDVLIDGKYYNKVGIRTKGSAIYTYLKEHKSDKYNYKLKFDYINKNQNYKRHERNGFKYKCNG